jgi:hypothetical protein
MSDRQIVVGYSLLLLVGGFMLGLIYCTEGVRAARLDAREAQTGATETLGLYYVCREDRVWLADRNLSLTVAVESCRP